MSIDPTTETIIAAFAGSIVGAALASLMDHYLASQRERHRFEEEVVQKYLTTLQDAAESLWWRLWNISDGGGRRVMVPQYYSGSTMYALGRFLSLKYSLATEGVFYRIRRIQPHLGQALREKVDAFEYAFEKLNHSPSFGAPLFRYDRQVLAEMVSVRDSTGYHPSTYLEFVNLIMSTESQARKLVAPAEEFVKALQSGDARVLMPSLEDVVDQLESVTEIPSKIPSETNR
ncbi:MAG: hypothetical protein JRN54_06120 [Nitrososphaerota archaeon]|jgi:hypothetical protein|nr:hypothetical protein [Nitrososphaerota archaeon]